ncbi:cyclin-domain-containing protein [Dichomitus squalens LYAD-421 SS1]|uniref:cyclin-domain-containing protein n=1 Tax=Dichomitus squalens (strain LYAD-421) TaxID=732165 RepID=UPI0004413409|nr:cyclin-domain-containing protein [Dichomitus squalens LYAD-421 SS1]EJF63086.1 cyclin-domain-containing protein [Dichomitus squalens LYAD-421 SS1]
MLALAPQPMHTPVDVPHRTQPPTPSSSTRPPFRKVTPSYTSASSSSHSAQTSHSGSYSSHSAPLEPTSSSRRSTPQRTPSFVSSARPSVYDGHEDDPSTPPGSESEDNEPESSVQSASSEVDIHAYDSTTLLRLLANALTEIATMNTDRDHSEPYLSSAHSHTSPSEPHPPIWRTLTTASRHALSTASSLSFHARNVPTIALEAYLTRIQKYCPASNEVFLSLLVYFDRMMKLAKESCGKVFAIDMYNVHRLVIAGVTVASKFFSDVFYTNSRYAKVGGLPLTELNQLELQFLLLNNFHLMISQDEMQFYASKLLQQSQVPPGVSLIPFLPDSSSSVPHDFRRSPIGPVKYFATLDGYVANLHARAPSTQRDSGTHYSAPPNTSSSSRTASGYRRSTSSYSTSSASDTVTDSGDTETDIDGETDDEPTIRAPHSSASSETMSLHSAASDADSIYTEDDRSEVGEVAHSHPLANGARTEDYRQRNMMSP